MNNPTIEFLDYLVRQCIEQCEVDPEITTVAQFLKMVRDAERPAGA